MHDVIILGGGPAGLSAALTLGRAHRDVLLIDFGQGRNAPAAAVHNFLLNDGTPPEQLRRQGRQQLAPYPSVRVVDDVVTAVERFGADEFVVTRRDGRAERARRLLLATGLADGLPPIDGLPALWGRSAFHCPYCHGFEVSGSPIGVLGGGPDRARLALHLRRFSDDVVMCADGPAELDDRTRAALDAGGVPVREERIVRLDGSGDRLEQIVLDGAEPLRRDAVFVKTTLSQRSDLAEKLGCAGFADGAIEVDEFGRTSISGVFAAGDMAHRATVPVPMAAVAVAASTGMIAGGVIDQDLLSVDTGLPNPFGRDEG